MKVLLINGSPHEHGCTYTALREVANILESEGIQTKIFHIGKGAVHGCIACGNCRKTGTCIFEDDVLADLAKECSSADGFIIGSPVYFAGPNGTLCALLDRLFFAYGSFMKGKPAAAVVSCRRGGASAAFERLNKYFTLKQMPVVSSQYWNSVHGSSPADVLKDKEGLQTMRTLGRNMAWLLNSIAAGNIPRPESEPIAVTSFADGK